MGSKTSESVTESLTTEEAKSRLREVAGHIGIEPWVRRQPIGSMLFGVLTGFLFGRLPHLLSRIPHTQLGRVIGRLAR